MGSVHISLLEATITRETVAMKVRNDAARCKNHGHVPFLDEGQPSLLKRFKMICATIKGTSKNSSFGSISASRFNAYAQNNSGIVAE
jgi:hypothetical protein